MIGQVYVVISQPMFMKPSLGLAHILGRTMTCYGDMVVMLFQRSKKVFSFRIRLKLVAVLIQVNSIYCLVKLLLSTMSFPNVPVCPVFGRRKVFVYLSQFLVKGITKLPQGIIYVNDRSFIHHDIITNFKSYFPIILLLSAARAVFLMKPQNQKLMFFPKLKTPGSDV